MLKSYFHVMRQLVSINISFVSSSLFYARQHVQRSCRLEKVHAGVLLC